jgi:MFS family permease
MVDAYSLAFAALLLPAGAIGDRFGRKPILIAGLGCSASLRCWPCSPTQRDS